MSWCTEAQALTWTGKTLTAGDLALASGIIDIYGGVTEDQPDTSITARDARWLAQATAYQAAWMDGKPGLLDQRESHTSTTADGVSVQRSSDSDVMLAPLAARCLRNLSWVGNRSTQTLPGLDRPKGSFTNEAGDEHNSWTPRPIS